MSESDWTAWEATARRVDARFARLRVLRRFAYHQPLALQADVPPALRQTYEVPVHYTAWGQDGAMPTLVCLGGVVSGAARFAFLAADLARAGQRVVCMDWVGRGRSGWLADDHEYGLETLIEQLRQLIAHLGGAPVALLGSELGATVAIEFASRHPELVKGLALNDTGPAIARARRIEHGQTLARWYVFRSPEEIMGGFGAVELHGGPVSEELRVFLAWHLTRWSEADEGRVYRHDPRAVRAYRDDARRAVRQWEAWQRVRCPVLLLHGMHSELLTAPTIERMRATRPLTLAHVPATGHAPLLTDRNQTAAIAAWLGGALPAPMEISIPLARPRPGLPILHDALPLP